MRQRLFSIGVVVFWVLVLVPPVMISDPCR